MQAKHDTVDCVSYVVIPLFIYISSGKYTLQYLLIYSIHFSMILFSISTLDQYISFNPIICKKYMLYHNGIFMNDLQILPVDHQMSKFEFYIPFNS